MNLKKEIQFFFDHFQRTIDQKNTNDIVTFFLIPSYFLNSKSAVNDFQVNTSSEDFAYQIKKLFSAFLGPNIGRTFYEIQNVFQLTDQELVTTIRWSLFDLNDELVQDKIVIYHLRQVIETENLFWKIYLSNSL